MATRPLTAMNTVVTPNGKPSPQKSLNFSSQQSVLIKCINLRGISHNRKHIKFEEMVKCFYYELDQPIIKPRPYLLTQLNKVIGKVTAFHDSISYCSLESFKFAKYQKYSDLIQLEGQVTVTNICYAKKITIRYTLTDWKTFSDIDAFFLNSIDLKLDRFMFTLRVNKTLLENTTESVQISMAVKYEFLDKVHWDNNFGDNYQFILHF